MARLSGVPVALHAVPAETITNERFRGIDLSPLDRLHLPSPVAALCSLPAIERVEFIEDDNRSAIRPEPVAELDGMPFYLSVKGIGSCVDPFSDRPLDRGRVREIAQDPIVRKAVAEAPVDGPDRFITGESWLRGSPYGGQGLGHATTALAVSERAAVTDLAGFRIAPVVKIARFPPELEERLRSVYWYRRYPGPFVQELRLVPSNVRIYFHARTTVGHDAGAVLDAFAVSSDVAALRFERNFVRSGLALLTLFARTLERGPRPGTYRGLEFHDVWLDKDAVLAPDGTVYFVDLEGIEPVTVTAEEVPERIADQFDRSLYELLFAFEQLELERRRRWGDPASRRERFEAIVAPALADDPFVRPALDATGLRVEVRNPLGEESLYTRFPLLDR